MQILSSILFALSASLDALFLGMSYGIRGISIRLWQNVLVSFITLFGTCLSISLGTLLLPFLSGFAASLLGAAALILLGLYYMSKNHIFKKSKEITELQKNSMNDTRTSNLKEFLVMGIFLSINNMGIGFSASITGLPFLATVLATLFFSILLLFLGNRLGNRKCFQLSDTLADILSGGLLVILGLIRLLTL